MNLLALEQSLRQQSGVLVLEPRMLRRIIKLDRSSGRVPPELRSHAIVRADLEAICGQVDLVLPGDTPANVVVLVARPTPRESGKTVQGAALRIWRDAFHARVQIALRNLLGGGMPMRSAPDDNQLYARIEGLGRTEFDEVRAILKHDELLLPPGDDRETFIKFVATYLELRRFAPHLLVTTFPGLQPFDRVDALLANDVNVQQLLTQGCVAEVDLPATVQPAGFTATFSGATIGASSTVVPMTAVSSRRHEALLRQAKVASARQNDVRAAWLCARATGVEDPALSKAAANECREAIRRLEQRIARALLPPADASEKVGATPEWASILSVVNNRAAADRGLRYSVEARFLLTLQKAALAAERVMETVDVPGFLLSLGKRKVVRELPATTHLRVARYIDQAQRQVRETRLASAEREVLARLMDWADRRATRNVRLALRPSLEDVFNRVGMVARQAPERLAREKLIEEILDRIILRGFFGFAELRDTVSRNQLKLKDLGGPRELWSGDPLLRADKELEGVLDGIYRRGDIYLRGLQKLSSVPFGTKIGRIVTLFGVLPFGGAYIILEGLSHIIGPLVGLVGLTLPPLLNWPSFLVTAAVLLGLIHSAAIRTIASQLLEGLGWLLALVFFRIPRAVFGHRLTKRIFAIPLIRLLVRQVLFPATVAGVVFYFTTGRLALWATIAIAAGSFVTLSVVMGSRLGALAEDFFVEQLAPTWRVVSRQWIPSLFKLIARFFAGVMDLMERGMYRVDEVLRYRSGSNPVTTFGKATIGLVWAMAAYVVRLYITLMVEPEVNPLKHFPVVTVAHKLMIPYIGQLATFFGALFKPLGQVIGGAATGITVFLFPSIFGFLAWELKENYRLYRATRAERLSPASVGPHGETMRQLLVVGLHSGTLPKLYERLRRAAQRDDESNMVRRRLHAQTKASKGLAKFRHGIREVSEGVRHFFEREFVAMVTNVGRWRFGDIVVGRIDLSSNRIRVELHCPQLSKVPARLSFEEHGGYVVVGFTASGFLVELQQQSKTGTILIENALAGFYQRGDVDLVRELLVCELGDQAHYQLEDGHLVVWPGGDYSTEYSYDLTVRRPRPMKPKVTGSVATEQVPLVDLRNILYRAQSIAWLTWVNAWDAAEENSREIPRLAKGGSLLPRPPGVDAFTPMPNAAIGNTVGQPPANPASNPGDGKTIRL